MPSNFPIGAWRRGKTDKIGGRVKLLNDPRNLTIRIDHTDLVKLRDHADRLHVTVASIVRSAVDKHLERLERRPWYRREKTK